MPPKLSEAAIDGKLVALRDYVRCHREELASRGSSCMKDVFAAQRNNEESRFYLFLYKYEAHFTEAQRRHVSETLAQHRESSGGAQCAAKAEQPAAGAEAVMKSVRDSSSSARGGFGQPLAKKARVAIEGSSSGGSQPAAAEGVLDIMADAAKTVTDRGTATGRVIMDQLSAADNKRRVRLLGNTYGFAASLRKKLNSSSS